MPDHTTTIRGHEAQIRLFPEKEALSHAAVAYLLEALEATLAAQDRFSLVLTGGSSPLRMYELLATEYRERVPWQQVDLFWGDDRYVAPDDPDSNQGAAFEAFIDQVPIPAANVYPMPTGTRPAEAAARAYEQTIKAYFGDQPPRFDLILLGLGPDGHVASLFHENHPERQLEKPDATPWVEAIMAPERVSPRPRLTMTFPLINQARRVLFIVPGAAKRDAVAQIVKSPEGTLPGAYVQAQDERVWYIDAEAWNE